ncbi:50S ribosomal protein L6 [Christensenellaceae bacterium OttesenSCG-928-L17]|nr:50S ribosomal protein L6 [Christensenellaceae bacterium OttesenSCG-928-L17]
MSRIGKLPVTVLSGVTITVGENNTVTVKGPKGQLSEKIADEMIIEQEDGVLTVKRPSDNKRHRAMHGLSRTLINNMVVGVTDGFSKTLEIVGVGYRAAMQGNKLTLNVGYSHPVEFVEPDGIKFEVPAPNRIVISGISKQLVGQVAADIRKVRKPEPYKGKGIRYQNEVVRRKEGKTGK